MFFFFFLAVLSFTQVFFVLLGFSWIFWFKNNFQFLQKNSKFFLVSMIIFARPKRFSDLLYTGIFFVQRWSNLGFQKFTKKIGPLRRLTKFLLNIVIANNWETLVNFSFLFKYLFLVVCQISDFQQFTGSLRNNSITWFCLAQFFLLWIF